MQVHLPDCTITRWSEAERWREERRRVVGSQAEKFWLMQERAADAVWNFSARLPTWPVASIADGLHLLASVRPDLMPFAPLALTNVQAWANVSGARGRDLLAFLDGQLLIAAQGMARDTNGLYGAVALDLYRRGVAHVEGGTGSMAAALARAVQAHGGQVLYRHEVTAIRRGEACPYRIETKRGSFEADGVLANLTPWALLKLMGDEAPASLRQSVKNLKPISSAFMAYLGVDEKAVEDEIEHHQVIVDPARQWGEGNSVFVSISPKWDRGRAPQGQRAITISTHTRAADWYALVENGQAFEER